MIPPPEQPELSNQDALAALLLERENQGQVCGGVSIRYQMLSRAIEALSVVSAVPQEKNEEGKDHGAALLPGDPLASPAKTEALPSRTLHDMRRASALCDEMIGPGTYQTRMIALAMIARQYLRELPEEK
jgi:hypothetical protein